MKKLRKIIFWCHLPVGVIAGVVILIMCVTGVLLSYEKQITSWAGCNCRPLALAIRRFLAWLAKRSKSLQPARIHVSEPIPNSVGD